MDRFILRFTGRGATPADDVQRIRSSPGVNVVDSASSRMLLVEALPESVQKLADSLPNWTCSGEQTIELPDPRPKIRSR
jgi:hypothetical protein